MVHTAIFIHVEVTFTVHTHCNAMETQRSERLISMIPYSGEFSSWDKMFVELKAVVIFTSETLFLFALLRALHCMRLGTPYVFVGKFFVEKLPAIR